MFVLLSLLSMYALSSEPANEAFKLWAVDPLVKVFADTQPQESKTIKICCAKNEFQSGQFVITARQKLENVTVALEPLQHESGHAIPEKSLTWNFVGSVPLSQNTYHTPQSELVRNAPARFPDPLLERRSITINAGDSQPVWLTVRVAADAPAGEYKGRITVSASEGRRNLDIELTVYPFALGNERHLFVTNWFSESSIAKFHNVDKWTDEFWEIMGRYAQNMAEHRQNVVQTPFPNSIERRKDGTLIIDYSRMDKWIQVFQKAGACDRMEFPPVAHRITEEGKDSWSSSELAINNISAKDQETGETVSVSPKDGMALMLTDLDKHLVERGWQDKAMIHVSDEPTIYKLESYCRIADFIHEHAPHLKVIEAIETTGFGKHLDVWVPKLSHLMNWYDELKTEQGKGAELWFYTCCHPYGSFPNRFIDFSLNKTRMLFWLNWKYGIEGYLHWGLNRWTNNPFEDVGDSLPPGDRFIIYPGERGPLNSIRWEAFREGLQDYEYFWLLTEQVKKVKQELGKAADFIDEKQRSDEICRSIVHSFTDYERSPKKLQTARRLLDVGCGTGTLAAMIAAGLPARIIGLDFVADMCRIGADKAGRIDPHRVRFLAGDAEHLPFRDRSFDIVTCSNSFHHYPHQDLAVREMFRVLRPGGRLILLDGFRDNVIGWFVFDVCVATVERHVRHAPWWEIKRLLIEAGFVRIRQRKFNLVFPLLLTVAQVPGVAATVGRSGQMPADAVSEAGFRK